MKILICHNYYQYQGGEEQVLSNEKRLLEEHGHRVILFTKDSKRIRSYNIIQKASLFLDTFFSFSVYKEIKKIIMKEKPDIVHIHNFFPSISPSIYWAIKRYKIPIVQTVHNYRFLCSNGLFLTTKNEICEKCKNGNFINGVYRKCYRNSYFYSAILGLMLYFHGRIKTFINRIDIFICPSEFLKKKLLEGGIPENKIIVKVHFIENMGIDINYDFTNYAIYMGRLSEEKGLLTLLEAFKNIPSLNLKILGEGLFRERLQDFVKKNKMANVEFLGFVDGETRFEILKKSTFLVFPSEWYETMGMAIIESFAFSKPVLASKIGAIKELVIDGVNGILFEPGNAKELAEKISYLFSNNEERMKMGRNARKIFIERFDKERNYNDLINIYTKAINLNNP